MLVCNLLDKVCVMYDGKWEKFVVGVQEVCSKKLGIVGYGNIGV